MRFRQKRRAYNAVAIDFEVLKDYGFHFAMKHVGKEIMELM